MSLLRRLLDWLAAKGKAVAAMAPYWGGIIMRSFRIGKRPR